VDLKMFRRAFDEHYKYRRLNPSHKRSPYSKLEGFVLLLPLVVVVLALALMGYALKYQAEEPVNCPKKNEIACNPEKVTIAVLVPKFAGHPTKQAEKSWIRIARNLGMRVVFFGPDDPDLPSVAISADDDITFTYKVLKWLNYRYGATSNWFIIAQERSFIHPYYLMKDIICPRDPTQNWYIGDRGLTPQSAFIPFAASGPGFVLSAPALDKLLTVWNLGKCPPFVAPDVTIGRCLKALGIDVFGSASFIPKYEHHYLKPLLRFVSVNVMDTTEMDELTDRFFTTCNY